MSSVIETLAVGLPQAVEHRGDTIETGIFKRPVEGPVEVGKLGIAGDGQADLTLHGGRDKAVYVYPFSHYALWAAELGVERLEPAQFGENLTVSGVDEQDVSVGDRFRFGTVHAIVTQPRLPCFKLGLRMQDPSFPARFLKSGRLGFYLRIESAGKTQAGDGFERIERATHGVSLDRLREITFVDQSAATEAAHCLEVMPHLDEGWRRRLAARAAQSGN